MVKTTVGGLIIKESGDEKYILLTKRTVEPYKDGWCIPGGHIDLNERAHDAIKREIKEETGLDFEGHFYAYFDEIIPEKNIHAVVLIFVGKGHGELTINEEVSEIRWVKLSEIENLSLAFHHNQIIKSYIRKA